MSEQAGDPTGEIREADVQAITGRIQAVTQARVLADVGKYEEALKILRRIRSSYEDKKQQERLDWMIQDIERRQQQAGG